jgi:hypothetical protein
MRVAIQLHGQPRYAKESYELGWKHLIEKYNADVYIHSWFDNKKTETIYHHALNSKIVSDEITKSTLKTIVELYNPVSFRYDTPLDYESIMHPYTNRNLRADQAIYGQHLSAYYANNLRECSKYTYDIILKSRMDIILRNFTIDMVEENTIKIPYFFVENSPMMNPALDHWALGTPESISKSCNLIHNLDYFISNGLPAQSEFLVHLQLVKEKVKIDRVPDSFALTRDYVEFGEMCFIPPMSHHDHYDVTGATPKRNAMGEPIN